MKFKDSLWFAFKNRVGNGGEKLRVSLQVGEGGKYYLDSTWEKIKDAFLSTGVVAEDAQSATWYNGVISVGFVPGGAEEDPEYMVALSSGKLFSCTTPDDYPSYIDEDNAS